MDSTFTILTLTKEERQQRMNQLYTQEMPALAQLCRQAGLTCRLEGEMLRVDTGCSSWYVCLHAHSGRLVLLHRSVYRPDGLYTKTPHYHAQKFSSYDLLETLEYIAEHDAWRCQREKPERIARREERREHRLEEGHDRRQSRRRMARSLSRIEAMEAAEALWLARCA